MSTVDEHAIRSSSPRLARTAAVVLLSAALLLFVGCGAEESTGGGGGAPSASAPADRPQPAAVDTAQATAEAEAIFGSRCATCHGAGGAGDGPASKGLSPPPRDFRNADWQAEVSDEHITNIVLYGGAAVGRSPTMPGNPDLISKPHVVEALVEHIRELGSG